MRKVKAKKEVAAVTEMTVVVSKLKYSTPHGRTHTSKLLVDHMPPRRGIGSAESTSTSVYSNEYFDIHHLTYPVIRASDFKMNEVHFYDAIAFRMIY